MACKNDESWQDTYVYKDECVDWWHLTYLRNQYNYLWDTIYTEEEAGGSLKAPDVRYGWSKPFGTWENNKQEQTQSLASIEGFFSVRFDEFGEPDEIYFIITGGDILWRIPQIPTSYSYARETAYGPWVVYLKDSCFGCTGFQFQNAQIEYSRDIECAGQWPVNIDQQGWLAQCIWVRGSGCSSQNHAEILVDNDKYCNFNWDWRADSMSSELTSNAYQKLGQTAKNLFYFGPVCEEIQHVCAKSDTWCCDVSAVAHYTERWDTLNDTHGLCPPSGEQVYKRRRLRWVSLGVNFSDSEGSIQITGGKFSGYVTQTIKASHLTEIRQKIADSLSGESLRKCVWPKCDDQAGQRSVWVFEEGVSTSGSVKLNEDISSRVAGTGSCNRCDDPAQAGSICACHWNDTNHLIQEYLSMVCECGSGSQLEGAFLLGVGSTDVCSCCKTRCCCDCKCEEDVTEEECLKKECPKNGPIWVGVYAKEESVNDSRIGEAKPCGCWNTDDPKWPDTACLETCGTKSCCTDIPGECPFKTTKCRCEELGGTWAGLDNGYPKECEGVVVAISTVRQGAGNDETGPCADTESGGSASFKYGGTYSCNYGVDDDGWVQIGSHKFTWTANVHQCYGAGGGTATVSVDAGDTITGSGSSAYGAVGWSAYCTCTGSGSGNPF